MTKILNDGEERPIYDYWVTNTIIADRQMDRERIPNIDEKSMRIHYFVAPRGVPLEGGFVIQRDTSNEHWVDEDYSKERVEVWGVQYQDGDQFHTSPHVTSDITAYRIFEKTFSDEYVDHAKRVIKQDYSGQDIFPEGGSNYDWTMD